MVKLKGPLLSLEASGSIGDVITYSKTKRTPYARVHGTHVDANSLAQQSARLMFGFVATQFLLIPDVAAESYSPHATLAKISNYNSYQAHNAARWARFAPPSQDHAAAESGSTSSVIFNGVELDGTRWKLTTTTGSLMDGWGLVFFASQSSGFTASKSNIIIATTDFVGPVVRRFWSPPTTGQWYFRMRSFTTDGAWGTLSMQNPPPL